MNLLRNIRPLVWLVLAWALAIPHAPAAPPAVAACVAEAAADNRACCKHCTCEAKPVTKSETPAPLPAAPTRGDSVSPLAPPTETMMEIPAPEQTPATGERLERTSDSAAAWDVRVPLYRRHCAFLI